MEATQRGDVEKGVYQETKEAWERATASWDTLGAGLDELQRRVQHAVAVLLTICDLMGEASEITTIAEDCLLRIAPEQRGAS